MEIRPLDVSDIPAAAALHRDSLDPALKSFLPGAQVGIENFWEASVRVPSFQIGAARYVAIWDGSVVGFSEWKLTGTDVLFLNYIAVHESVRGRGIGTKLIARGLRDHESRETVALDAFTDNEPAIALYAKLGFKVAATRVWLHRDLTSLPPSPCHLEVIGWENALVRLEAFGFTSMDVTAGARTFSTGLVGRSVINCLDPELFLADEVLAALRYALPQRVDALLVVEGGQEYVARTGANVLRKSIRMEAPRADVIDSLSE